MRFDIARPGSGRWPSVFVDCALVASVAAMTSAWSLFSPSLTQDETVLLMFPDLIGDGRVPNRDFFTPYGPGTFWPLTLTYMVGGGPSVWLARLVGLAYHVILCTGVWALLRGYGRWVAVTAGGIAGVLCAGLLLTPYGWLLALGAILWALVAMDRERWFLAGLAAAVACTVRPEFAVVVAAVVAVRLAHLRQGRRFAAGFLVGGLPLAAHLAIAGDDLARNVVFDRLGVRTGLPFPDPFSIAFIALVTLLLGTVLVVAGSVSRRSRTAFGLSVLCLVLLPQAVQRIDRVHILFVAIVVLPVAVAMSIRRRDSVAEPWFVRPAAFAMCTVAVVIGIVLLLEVPRPFVIRVGDRELFAASAADARAIRDTALRVRSLSATDRRPFVSVEDMSEPGVNAAYLYFLLPDRTPHAYYLDLAPGVSERSGSGLLRDVRRAPILVLSDFTEAQRRSTFPYLPKGSGEVNRYVAAHFCPQATVERFTIYARCAGAQVS